MTAAQLADLVTEQLQMRRDDLKGQAFHVNQANFWQDGETLWHLLVGYDGEIKLRVGYLSDLLSDMEEAIEEQTGENVMIVPVSQEALVDRQQRLASVS